MPIYEYQCQACDNQLEALQKMSDAPLLECPACGKPSLKKKVSAVAFRLKGGGWYETDFKTGSKRNIAGSGEGASEGASAGGNASAGSSSESKPTDSGGAKSNAKDSAKSA